MTRDNQEPKKTNSYKKTGLIMLAAALFGAVLGLLSMFLLGGRTDDIQTGMTDILSFIQRIMLPALLIITIATIILGERSIRRLRAIGEKIRETEDEECDRWEYEEEKTGAFGVMSNILSQVFCVLILSAGYSVKYITDGNHKNMLAACLVFLGCYAYNGVYQTRYVKTVQAIHPGQKGDPSSRKFRQQWLDSCDEAQKELIYQSAYKTYSAINTWIPILLVFTMLGHLFFDTGIMAIVVVAVIWIVAAGSYLHSCVNMKGAKLRE